MLKQHQPAPARDNAQTQAAMPPAWLLARSQALRRRPLYRAWPVPRPLPGGAAGTPGPVFARCARPAKQPRNSIQERKPAA